MRSSISLEGNVADRSSQVHEGPHGIGTRITYNDCKLQAGMTISNEPGCYLEGKFGIRIENIVVVQPCVPLFPLLCG